MFKFFFLTTGFLFFSFCFFEKGSMAFDIKKVRSNTELSYPWLSEKVSKKETLGERILPPQGYKRMSQSNASFANWLLNLPLEKQGTPVLLFNGKQKPYQAGAFAVIKMDIGQQDLQQCADAVMRLKAEYHFSKKEFNKIHFNYTSGHKIAFSDWAKGIKPKVNGNKVTFSAPNGKEDYSYNNFKKYLNNVFMFAGTASLEKELKKVPNIQEVQPGDVFIKGGFPGHAIIVMDVAINDKNQKVFLLAQSYMPAQSIHILNNLNHKQMSPWYSLEAFEKLQTPEWTFETGNLKRFVQ